MARRRGFDEDLDDEVELTVVHQEQFGVLLQVLKKGQENTAAAIGNIEKLIKMVEYYKNELQVLQEKYQKLLEAKGLEK